MEDIPQMMPRPSGRLISSVILLKMVLLLHFFDARSCQHRGGYARLCEMCHVSCNTPLHTLK